MTNLQLTEHFNLIEFERSSTATANGIDNSCPYQYIPVLQQLCKTILEPLRQHFGEPVIISSGYRCPTLNIRVGGVYSSQHTLGEAADIVPPYNQRQTPYSLNEWFEWLQTNTDFDQLILEHNSQGSYWIHVSCRKNKSKNRHQVIRNLVKK